MSLQRLLARALAPVAPFVLVASLVSPAPGSDSNSDNCIRGSLGCKIGVENLECGAGGGSTGWHCKSTWKNNCLCFSYGSNKGSWWSIVGQTRTVVDVPLQPNTVSTFQTIPDPGNVFGVFETSDPSPDSAFAEIHSGPTDLFGQFRVAIMPGLPDSLPAQILALQIYIASFTFEGVPTGPNHVILAPGPPVPGTYDQTLRILDFNERVPCILTNDQYPGGRQIYIRPRAVASNNGSFLLDLSPSLFIPGQTSVADAGMVMPTIRTAPNPFRERTTIVLGLPIESTVALDVFDMHGRAIRSLTREQLSAGSHYIVWNGRDALGQRVGNGIYFIRGSAAGRQLTAKVILTQ